MLLLFSILAVSIAQQWQIQKADLAEKLWGISFPTAQTGFVAGIHLERSLLLRTDDGGNTYTQCQLENTPPPLYFTDLIMASPTSGVVTGAHYAGRRSTQYTLDGKTWNFTNQHLFEDSQSAELIQGVTGGFALTGSFNTSMFDPSNGVATSVDQGVTWNITNITIADGDVRYGSFPSLTTWYVTSSIRGVALESKNLRSKSEENDITSHHSRKLLQAPGYLAQIIKTTDGGKTWQTVYYNTTAFYLNGIVCISVLQCWAVGESGDGSQTPACPILHTNNGGITWEQQLYLNQSGCYLVDIIAINRTELWVIGGTLGRHTLASYWHSTDGGRTWSSQEIEGLYPLSITFAWASPTQYVAWSTGYISGRAGSNILIYK